MADTIKIGTQDATYKVGSSAVTAIYLGSALVYSGGTTPPTPTYQWVLYQEGDTVPSATVYGVKLYTGLDYDCEIDFGDTYSGVAFVYDHSSVEWSAIDYETYDPIDISGYFDGYCYTILFSDIGYGGMPIESPAPGNQFEFDIDLYEQA